MKLCIISSKECWQNDSGAWESYGGFPLQMSACASLFEQSELIIVRSKARAGALPLPTQTKVIPLREPSGTGLRRKLDVLLHMPGYLRVLVRQIRRADVVHVPLPGDIPLLGLMAAVVCGKPVIARYGGSWESTSITTWANRFTRGFMKMFAGGRNLMLATGDGAAEPARGMQWIFSTALTHDELASIAIDANRALSSPPQLIYAGRLSTEKGVDTLIEAVHLLQQLSPPVQVKVTIAGDGPQRADLESLSRKLGCENSIRFVGQVDRHRLSSLMASADFGVQASRTEGLSKAWLDAMAHGLPVLASEVGAARAVIVGEGIRGWLVPPSRPDLLAATIVDVIQSPRDWTALRRRCRQYAEARTIERWAEEIGQRCAERWNCSFRGGKLKAASI